MPTLTVHDLKRETRLDVLIEKLDKAFKDEIVKDTYSIYWKCTILKKTNKYFNEWLHSGL